MTPEAFYLWQLDQEERFELVEGAPMPLRPASGASNVHDVIKVNCICELAERLRGKTCRVASANTALRTSLRTARRPDVTVDCTPPDANSYESGKPAVVIDVLAPAPRAIDRFTKLDEYRRHPTLRHILLVEPGRFAAKLHSRPAGGEWSEVDLIGKDAVIDLDAIEVSLPLASLYERLEMEK